MNDDALGRTRQGEKNGTKRDRRYGSDLTARELAKLIGVSQSTISRAFTDGASVSPKTRDFVLRSAERLNYRPNAIASILSRRRSDIVAVVVSELDNPFYPALLEMLTERLQDAGYQPLLFFVPPGRNMDEQLLRFRQYNVEAMIVLSATISSGTAIKWASDGRCVILINRMVEDAPVRSVSCDNEAGAAKIADLFYEVGFRRVGFVAGRQNTSTNSHRERGFIRRLAEVGLVLGVKIDAGEYSYEAGYMAALGMELRDLQGIFFANDILAIGGIDALREVRGLRVPEDVGVVGFDDIAMASWPHYRLTTVRQPVRRMIDRAMDLLLAWSNGEAEEQSVDTIGSELILRGTTPTPS